METYKFNQSRKVTTIEKTTIAIYADSFEEAVERAEKLTPFSEHEGSYDEDYFVEEVELDTDMVIEVSPDDNNGEATVQTWFGDKFLFDNTSEEETGSSRIKRLMNEGMLGPFYVSMGIEYMKRCLDAKTDEQVYKDFGGLFSPQMVRNNVNYMHRQIFPEQYNEEQTTINS